MTRLIAINDVTPIQRLAQSVSRRPSRETRSSRALGGAELSSGIQTSLDECEKSRLKFECAVKVQSTEFIYVCTYVCSRGSAARVDVSAQERNAINNVVGRVRELQLRIA